MGRDIQGVKGLDGIKPCTRLTNPDLKTARLTKRLSNVDPPNFNLKKIAIEDDGYF